jgi:hypothetical protein
MMNENDLPPDARWLIGWVRVAANCLLEVGKPVGLLSVPGGIWFLARYSSEVHIPFPIGSSTLSALFVVVIVMVCYVLLIIAMSMLWVMLQSHPFRSDRLRREAPHLRSHVQPLYGLWFKIGHAGADVERRRRRRRRRFSAMASQEYLLVHAPFLAVWLVSFVLTIFALRLSGITFFLLLIVSFLVGAATTTASFYRFRSKTFCGGRAESDWTRTRKFVLATAKESAITIVSLFPYLAIMDAMGSAETRLFGVEVLLIILAAHYIANISRSRPLQTTLTCLIFLSLPITITPGTPLLAGAALRMLGIGGGMAREVTLQTTDPVSGKQTVRVIDGCLLLSTSDSISLHPVYTAKQDIAALIRATCVLPRMLHDISASPDQWSVETYPASSVIRVTTATGDAK